MRNINKRLVLFVFLVAWLNFFDQVIAQNTKIRGFVDVGTAFEDDQLNFKFGEYDLFITSELNDNISFLGETVFRYSANSPTEFDVSVERIVLKYNYKGNHSLLIGKHHTPINYWNDSYHHGRVFFPTIDRPILFSAHIIPIHTTGLAFEGLNLGKLKFGYNLMIGNGLGSEEIRDNDKYKSITAGIHIKPVDKLQIGLAYYNDVISEGTEVHDNHLIAEENIKQQLLTGTVAYFGSKFEVLAEGTFASSKADVLGKANAFISYLYAGVRVKEKWVPYFRIDNLSYQDDEFYFDNNNTTSIVTGLRFEINYLTVVKLEYQYVDTDLLGSMNKLSAQLAIGF
ncbi:MAG: hypothetical protein QNK20_04210 [Aureibaculum sp.]|nr:hypothetical protein [Aureibaculum sp.]